MCGGFATSLNKDLLIEKRGDAGKASTQLQSMVKARLTMSDELGSRDVIDSTKLKEITGETPMSYRGLQENQKGNFTHHCTLWLNSNCGPKFDELDPATKNRLVFVPCEKQWKDNPDLNLSAKDCLGNDFKKQLAKDPEKV